MSSFKADKRTEGASLSSSSPSPQRPRRTGRDAAAWEDADLFGEAEEASSGGEFAAGSPKADSDGKPSLKKQQAGRSTGNCTRAAACRCSNFLFLFSVYSDPSSASHAAEAEASAPAAAEGPRVQRRQRQPPLQASSFLLHADGSQTDGLLSLYCSLNYARERLHKYKFVDTQEERDRQTEECERELQAAEALQTLHAHQQQQGAAPAANSNARVYSQQEAARAAAVIQRRKRQLARLAAEERLYLREDLNTLLTQIREGLLACYPYNEHLSRLARRLEKISTQPALWAAHRPRLLQLHKANFLRRWEDAGWPAQPHKLLQPETDTAGGGGEGGGRGGGGGGEGWGAAEEQQQFGDDGFEWQGEEDVRPSERRETEREEQTERQTQAAEAEDAGEERHRHCI
ncbi:hypothetical protein Efla_002638 [Eimeria flavescens]